MPRIQFILKSRETLYTCDVGDETTYSYSKMSSGLFNSARFVERMLADQGFDTEIDHAIDNNCIDRLVTGFKPDIVVIEAYWVVPSKLAELTALHPQIKWIIRNHSATPFMATEGQVFAWSLAYMQYPNVMLCCNDERANREMQDMVACAHPDWSRDEVEARVFLLPNYYPSDLTPRAKVAPTQYLDIGCFGAIRPLKNQLIQAVAAIRYAEQVGKTLRFHINGTRIEGRGDPVLHNLRGLFADLSHELVEHSWMPHANFAVLLRSMDVCMQVSYTETFNIVTADAVVNDVPVVTSNEIKWVNPLYYADPNDSRDIAKALKRALWSGRRLCFWRSSLNGIKAYNRDSVALWRQMIASFTAD